MELPKLPSWNLQWQQTLSYNTGLGQAEPGVLNYFDVDDTLIPWTTYNQEADSEKLRRTQDTLIQFEGQTVNALCTARGLSSIQELVPLLKDIPLKMIGANGGQQVYWNYQDLPTDMWLAGLKPEDSDAQWNQTVAQRSGGFSTVRALGALRDTLGEFGFRQGFEPLPPPLDKREVHIAALPGNPKEVAVVAITPDQTTFMLRANPKDLKAPLTDAHRELARQIGKSLEKRLASMGVLMTSKKFIDDAVHTIYLMEPRDVDKQSLVRHLLGRMPSIQAVITAGDNTNDTMLKPPTYGQVPNYRIISGSKPEVVNELAGQTNVDQVPRGDLSVALEPRLSQLLSPPPQQPDNAA